MTERQTDPNIMPEFVPLPHLKAVGQFFLDILHSPLPSHVLSHGDHERGAEAMLGRAVLDGQMTAQEAYDALPEAVYGD